MTAQSGNFVVMSLPRAPLLPKLSVLAEVDFETIRVGTPQRVGELAHGIERFIFTAPYETLGNAEWQRRLRDFSEDGLRLIQSEWHHARFSPARGEQPARSRVAISLHVEQEGTGRRWALEGELDILWSQRRDAVGNPLPARVDATEVQMSTRQGPPAFERILSWSWPADGPASRLHPILVYDLDRDGRPEIVSAGAARVAKGTQPPAAEQSGVGRAACRLVLPARAARSAPLPAARRSAFGWAF